MATRPWLPTDAVGVTVIEFDPSLLSGPPASGSSVASLTSKDGSVTASNASSTAQPTYNPTGLNGYPSLTFSGAQILRTPAISQGPYWAAFAAAKQSATNNTQNVLDGDNFNIGTNARVGQYLRFDSNGSVLQSIAFTPAVSTATASTSAGTTLAPKVLAASLPSRTVQASVNGGTLATATLNADPIGASALLSLGAWTTGGQQFRGDIAYWCYARGVLTQDDYDRFVGYMAWRFGLQANLPANHPYKAAAPTVDTGGGTSYNDTLSEAGSASDAASTAAVYGASRAEALTASDIATAAAILAAAQSEPASASDLVSTGGAVAVSITESLSASDAVTGATTFLAALTEAVAASDIVVTGAAMGAVSEAVTASDVATGTATFSASLAEAASAADTVAGSLSGAAVLAEPAAASDLVAGGGAVTLAIAESVTATDAVAAGTISVGALLEAGSAIDAISYTYLPNPYPYITPDVLLSGSLVGPVTLRAQMQAGMITLQARLRN